MPDRPSVSFDDLATDPHPVLHQLRAESPVIWIEPLDAWLVTSHELCVEVMLDPDAFTVDDPRFSTQQVIGPSMLSLDGFEHRRHRDPFAGPFRAAKVRELHAFAKQTAGELIADVASRGGGDLRAEVAGPLAVAVMADVLDLHDVAVDDVLSWYEEIVAAVHEVTAGGEVPESAHQAFADLKSAVAVNRGSSALLGPVETASDLTVDEIVSNVAVLLFGGIVTSESGTAIAYRYLLEDPDLIDRIRRDRSLVRAFVEEVFRLEPSAAAVDRYATIDVTLGGVHIRQGELVRVSLTASNRDPAVFADPDRFDLGRESGRSLTFARGPHACLGIHLARLEADVAVSAFIDHPDSWVGDGLDPISGLVFRVPQTVQARIC